MSTNIYHLRSARQTTVTNTATAASIQPIQASTFEDKLLARQISCLSAKSNR